MQFNLLSYPAEFIFHFCNPQLGISRSALNVGQLVSQQYKAATLTGLYTDDQGIFIWHSFHTIQTFKSALHLKQFEIHIIILKKSIEYPR